MALKSRQPQAPHILPHERDRAAKIARVIRQVSRESLLLRRRQKLPAFLPLAPVLAEQRLRLPVSRPVMNILLGEGQPHGPLVVAQAPGPGDKLARDSQRAEPLV